MLVILFCGFYPPFSGCKDNLINVKLKTFRVFFITKILLGNSIRKKVKEIKKPHTLYEALVLS